MSVRLETGHTTGLRACFAPGDGIYRGNAPPKISSRPKTYVRYMDSCVPGRYRFLSSVGPSVSVRLGIKNNTVRRREVLPPVHCLARGHRKK